MLSPSIPWCNELCAIVEITTYLKIPKNAELSARCADWPNCTSHLPATVTQMKHYFFILQSKTAYLAPTYSVTHWPVKLFMLWYCEDGLDHLLQIYISIPVWLVLHAHHTSCWYMHWNSTHQKNYMWLIRNSLEALHRFEADAPFTISSPNST